MELLAEIVNDFQLQTIFVKSSILDVWQGSKYASVNYGFLTSTAVLLEQRRSSDPPQRYKMESFIAIISGF